MRMLVATIAAAIAIARVAAKAVVGPGASPVARAKKRSALSSQGYAALSAAGAMIESARPVRGVSARSLMASTRAVSMARFLPREDYQARSARASAGGCVTS